jgi:ribosomal-protein-alanine N-acetyltransferase
MHYRQAFSEDSVTLSKIHEECFPRYWDSSAFTNFFAIENTRAVLAEKRVGPQVTPVAMMVYRVVHESSDIITLAVCHPWRRQGIANDMMARAIAHAKALGAKSMFLDVEDGNQPALGLYESLGFRQINRRKDYYKQKDGSFTDALVMTCELA